MQLHSYPISSLNIIQWAYESQFAHDIRSVFVDKMKSKAAGYIHRAFGFAMLLGLFNFSYDEAKRKFGERRILSIYGRCWRWVVNILVLRVVWDYYLIIPGVMRWSDTARIQDRVLWYINIVQLYLGVFMTYTSHSFKKSHLLRLLNRVVKCNRNLVRLLGEDIRPVRRSYLIQNIRIVAVVVDILLTWNRPHVFKMITHEWRALVVFNKVVLASSFLGQHHVQEFIAGSFRQMESFLDKRKECLSAEECRLVSKICSQLKEIRMSSNAYHAIFGFISYFSLIRTICFFYSSFSALFTGGILRVELLSIMINYFFWMIVPGLTPIIDIILLGVAADAVTAAGKGLHWKIFMTESKSATSTAAHRLVETILLKEHVGSMQTVIASGAVLNRSFSFQTVVEGLSWVVVAFVYGGGRFNSAAMGLIAANLKIKNVLYLLFLSLCFAYGLWCCIHVVKICFNNARKWMNDMYYGDEKE